MIFKNATEMSVLSDIMTANFYPLSPRLLQESRNKIMKLKTTQKKNIVQSNIYSYPYNNKPRFISNNI